MPFSTTRFEISSSPVRAVIVTSREISVPAFVMNIFEPSMTHSPPSSRAVVRVAPASDPAPGSVSPNAASRSPEASAGQPPPPLLVASRRARSASCPSDVCAATVMANDWSTRASSSIAIA